jgi:hypothetical protein
MDFPVFLETLASSNVERFHAEAEQHRLVSAALGPHPSRVRSLGRSLWAMAAGLFVNGKVRHSAHRAVPQGGVYPS